jgi:hypothetical protein
MPEQYPTLSALGAELRFMMITSEARVHPWQAAIGSGAAGPPDSVPATGIRRQRGMDPGAPVRAHQVHPLLAPSARCRGVAGTPGELCGRCVGNLTLPGERGGYS